MSWKDCYPKKRRKVSIKNLEVGEVFYIRLLGTEKKCIKKGENTFWIENYGYNQHLESVNIPAYQYIT